MSFFDCQLALNDKLDEIEGVSEIFMIMSILTVIHAYAFVLMGLLYQIWSKFGMFCWALMHKGGYGIRPYTPPMYTNYTNIPIC